MPQPRSGRDIEAPLKKREVIINTNRPKRGQSGRFRKRKTSTTASEAARRVTDTGLPVSTPNRAPGGGFRPGRGAGNSSVVSRSGTGGVQVPGRSPRRTRTR